MSRRVLAPSQTGDEFSYFATKVRWQRSTSTTHTGILVGVDGSPPSKAAVDWGGPRSINA
jgi:hypothetical protein